MLDWTPEEEHCSTLCSSYWHQGNLDWLLELGSPRDLDIWLLLCAIMSSVSLLLRSLKTSPWPQRDVRYMPWFLPMAPFIAVHISPHSDMTQPQGSSSLCINSIKITKLIWLIKPSLQQCSEPGYWTVSRWRAHEKGWTYASLIYSSQSVFHAWKASSKSLDFYLLLLSEQSSPMCMNTWAKRTQEIWN